MKKYGHFSIRPLLHLLEPAFSKVEILEIFYRITKRTGKGHDVFLIVDNRDHPKRDEVFLDFMKNDNFRAINIPGLFPDEIKKLWTNFFENVPKTERFQIHLNSLKSPQIPAIVFTKKYNALILRNDFLNDGMKSFPDFIFQFEGLKRLTLNLHSEMIIPEDWSSFNELTILTLSKEEFIFQRKFQSNLN